MLYEKAAHSSGKPLFSLTVADFFNAPAVDAVDLSAYSGATGNEIVIQAHDDFEVTSVNVSINDVNGEKIESGGAMETPAKSGRWVYTATTTVNQGTESAHCRGRQ